MSSTGRKRKSDDEEEAMNWLSEGTSRADLVRSRSQTLSDMTEGQGTESEMLNSDGTPAVWTPQPGGTLETIASPGTCAQVEPRELCEFLREECEKRGVRIHLATKATKVVTDSDGVLQGLRLESVGTDDDDNTSTAREIQCQNIILCAGAWTSRVFTTLFPHSKLRISIEPLAGYSITFKSPRYKTPFVDPDKRDVDGGKQTYLSYAIYCAPGRYWDYAPEAFARIARDGEAEVWIGGLNDPELRLPELATDVKGLTDPECVADVRRTMVRLTGLTNEADDEDKGDGIVNDDDLITVREGLCFRPVSSKGTPIIAKIADKDLGGVKSGKDGNGGVWIASGHGPWGISLSLGTGLVVSEMVQGKKPSADVRRLAFR
jgi:glycine/D-amino acid oxidase-like deaminating enzyme